MCVRVGVWVHFCASINVLHHWVIQSWPPNSLHSTSLPPTPIQTNNARQIKPLTLDPFSPSVFPLFLPPLMSSGSRPCLAGCRLIWLSRTKEHYPYYSGGYPGGTDDKGWRWIEVQRRCAITRGVTLRKERHERSRWKGEEWVRGREGGRHESHPRIATGENVVLFMRRSVVDRDSGFFKDQIVTTDTQSERDKGPSGASGLYL